jgi:hypothetical protein
LGIQLCNKRHSICILLVENNAYMVRVCSIADSPENNVSRSVAFPRGERKCPGVMLHKNGQVDDPTVINALVWFLIGPSLQGIPVRIGYSIGIDEFLEVYIHCT